MTMIDVAEVCAWAREAGAIALRHFRTVQGQRKADNSIVTQADLEIEQMLRERIQQRYPHHAIIGEEQGGDVTGHEYIWALDPVDGTNAFAFGLPTWGISIGILRNSQPFLGVIYIPVSDDMYWNEAAAQAYWNGQPIRVSAATDYDGQDWITVSSYAHLDYDITFRGKTRSTGSTVAHCCYVAQGEFGWGAAGAGASLGCCGSHADCRSSRRAHYHTG
ncbi:MAG: inositol monophosphatase [Chloroflexaceae bacterium]|nr:inositol monophosphatase [Chloroflexaceae bacterium]